MREVQKQSDKFKARSTDFLRGKELKLVVYHVNVFRFFFVTGSIVIPRSGSLRDWAISILSNTNIETR